VSAVNLHAKGPTHLAKLKRQNEEPTQSKIILGATGKVAVASSSLGKKIAAEEIPEELYALRAEVYETLHKVEYNASFHSAQDDAKRFQLMFPGNNVAEQYACGATKATYLLTHGVSPYLKMRMIEDCANVPFTIKFDETTTSQVKKQFDMYICYWSPRHDEVVNKFVGSKFVGHCTAEDVHTHTMELMNEMKLSTQFLLHIGMDGPNVNLKF
jgi:hypothetical protein